MVFAGLRPRSDHNVREEGVQLLDLGLADVLHRHLRVLHLLHALGTHRHLSRIAKVLARVYWMTHEHCWLLLLPWLCLGSSHAHLRLLLLHCVLGRRGLGRVSVASVVVLLLGCLLLLLSLGRVATHDWYSVLLLSGRH